MDDTPPDDTPRKKREPAQGDLRGLIGRWMEDYGQDRLDLVYSLQQILNEVLAGVHANYTWRLRRIEQVLELPAEPWWDQREHPCKNLRFCPTRKPETDLTTGS